MVVGEADNTVHLRDEECLTLDLLDLTEAHFGANVVADRADVLRDVTRDGARAVSDVEVLAISLVCG